MDFADLTFTAHALVRMFERRISVEDVRNVVSQGEIIQSYPDDRPIPSVLLLGEAGSHAIHVVAAKDPKTEVCYVITAYVPRPEEWTPDLRKKR